MARVSVTSERDWGRLCVALQRPELADRRPLRDQRGACIEPRRARGHPCRGFTTKPRAYWELTLTRSEVPWGAVLRWEDLRYHSQVRDNDCLVEVDADPWGPRVDGRSAMAVLALRRHTCPDRRYPASTPGC